MLLESLIAVETRFKELNKSIEENIDDYQKVAELSKEKSDLEEIVEKANFYRQTLKSIEEAESLLELDDEDMRNLAQEDLEKLNPLAVKLEAELKNLLVPKDPRDRRNVIIEIRAGTGGDEAGLFAADLFRMYTHYAENHRWTVEVLSQNETGIGGLKEIIFMIKGRGAYSRFKYESGVHRVQRIPSTESSGRIHTSTVTVAVLAEAEDVDIQIPESDLRIDVYKSAGAGGQNVQKNMTAVRITHLPTNIVVACQDERSQLQNRQRAMSILRARLYEIEEEKRLAAESASRRSQVGSGERAEKIRTYNYPQSRVTDHRINVSSHNLPNVMEGNLDVFIDELAMQDEAERLSEAE
ncbi:peptide chain release factor 1 [Pelolinea submarina]|uniref:Peptide chain release factor 1 n=1 Tax=Pelolinea submarina TaxID=913107 RepID=A0A347ZSS8_9CHLR|nr:peptide chain release factor 1 [Pelolinea submarina]REG11067.1 peptide chain release factor 1 [Pelolinea submarina]BBB48359.1 peptide chain release factor 1 [Pelolinea submarina]